MLEASETCPIAAVVDDQEQLNTLRSFRDTVLSKHIAGQILTYLFYRNAPELTALLKQHDDLREQVRLLVDEYSPLIGEVARGGTACLWANDKQNILEILQAVKDKGSAQLKADIDLVLEGIASGNTAELFGITVER
jgi:hypothetical protein